MIDLDDIQSIVARPSPAGQVDIYFLRMRTRAGMQQFAARAARLATTATKAAERWARSDSDPRRYAAVNIGISGAGIELAGIGARTRAALPPAFLGGMRTSAERLGDVGPSDPKFWPEPFNTPAAVHAVVLVHGRISRRRRAGLRELLDIATYDPGASGGDAPRWQGRRLPGGFEPFGFRDNISDPVIEGSGKALTPGNGAWDERLGRWRAVRPGEAVLGYPDESGAIAGHPDAAHIERNGSYLVLRKLEQDVPGFWRACDDWARDLGIADPPRRGTPANRGPKLHRDARHHRVRRAGVVAAQMVGRQWTGAPLGAEAGGSENDFLYRQSSGSNAPACPPTAHIRRANPRDDLAFAGNIVPRHLLFRRGLPYREPGPDDSVHQGLLFMACCADLHRQFEFVQAQWLQDGSRFGLGRERDPIVGSTVGPGLTADDSVSIEHGGVRCRRPFASFVETRGGDYFLLPGCSTLALLGASAGMSR